MKVAGMSISGGFAADVVALEIGMSRGRRGDRKLQRDLGATRL